MTISNVMFDFTPKGRNHKNLRRALITGMTMTIYDSRFNLANDVLEALGNPSGISIVFEPQLEAFAVYADEDGHPVANHRSGKQFSQREVRDILTEKYGCDFVTNYYRIENGRKYGKYVLFSPEDLFALAREKHNGNN